MAVLRKRLSALVAPMLLFTVMIIVGAPVCLGQVLSTQDLAIELQEDSFRLINPQPGFSEAAGRLIVRDGKNHQEFELSFSEGARREQDGMLIIEWALLQELEVRASVAARRAHVSVILEFENRGTEQRWLETGVSMDLGLIGEWSFWDGLNTLTGAAGLSHTLDILPGVFPAAALYTSNTGIGVGIEPMQLLSYLRSSVVSDDGRRAEFEYATRIVVDPGTSERVEFVLIGFDARWGHLGLLQRYTDEFAKAFRPWPGVDTRVSMSGAQYRAWNANDPEMCRRSFSGWEWAYAPFRRTGDIYGHREFWDYTPARPFGSTRGLDYDEFHEWRRNQFLRGVNCDVAMLFYVPSGIWVEYQLAQERFSEAMLRESGVTIAKNDPWVTGHDNERRVFPFGNEYAEQFRADMRRVVEEVNMQGFAFDVANGGVRVYAHNTKGVMEAPGRAFDEQGVFVEEGVAIALLMDYARTLTKDGRPMAVVSNPSAKGVYMTVFRSDAAMFEAPPWGIHGTTPEHLRARLGHKTLVWWEGWDFEELLDTDRGPAEVQEAFLGVVDYMILKSLELGGIPAASYMRGVPQLGRVLPMLAELVQAGWQPVPAVMGAPEGFWLSRYGRGGRSYVTAGNATLQAFEGRLSVDNRYLGDLDYLFTHFDGQGLRNRIQARTTGLDVAVASRRPFVARTVLGVRPVENEITAAVSQIDNLSSITTEAVFELRSPQTLTFVVESPVGYSLQRVELNGSAVEARTKDGLSEFSCQVSDGDILRVHYASEVYRLSRDELLAFDFITSDLASQAVVLVADDPTEEELYAAYRIQKYFTDYIGAWRRDCSGVLAAGGMSLGTKMWWMPQIFCREADDSWHLMLFNTDFFDRHKREAREPGANRPRVVLVRDLQGADGIVELRDDGRTLFIGAADERKLQRLVMDLLYELDSKYAYFGPLIGPLQHELPRCY